MRIKNFILEDIIPLHIYAMFVPSAYFWANGDARRSQMVADMCNIDLGRLHETTKLRWLKNTNCIWRHYGLSAAND